MNRLNHMSPLLTTGVILVVATAFVTNSPAPIVTRPRRAPA